MTRREFARTAVGTLLVAPGATAALAAGKELQLKSGQSDAFTFHDVGGFEKDITVHYYLPEKASVKTAPVLFVMHGTLRNGAEYRDQWKAHADRYGFLLLVPEFSRTDFPGGMYNRGNVLGKDDEGPARPQNQWSFTVIERLFDYVRAQAGIAAERYHIYGHSAGGQFVHRLALFLPEARYVRAVSANAGYYTLPTAADSDDAYPFSLKGSPAAAAKSEASLRTLFGRDLVVLLGEADTDPKDPDLYHSPEADKQGMYRFARGHYFYNLGKREAERLGIPLAWSLKTVPGVGHSNEKMAGAAAAALFGKNKKTTVLNGETTYGESTLSDVPAGFLRRGLCNQPLDAG